MRFKRINLKWFKSIITLLIIVAILNFFKNMNVYVIASILMITVIVLALQFSMNESDRYRELMTPKIREFHHEPKEKNCNVVSIEQLRKMNPYAFEEYVASMFRELGWMAKTTKSTGDGGKDVVMYRREDETRQLYYVECKRYKGTVGRPVIQKLVGAALADNAIPYATVTTGKFTKEAEAEAKKVGVRCIGPKEIVNMQIEVDRKKGREAQHKTTAHTHTV